MSNVNLIYGLKDPRNDVYKYIGKTTIGKSRPLTHLINSHNKLINTWVDELKSKDLYPIVEIIETNIELDNLISRERYWIYYYSQISELFNGGETHSIIKSPSKYSDGDVEILYKMMENINEVYKKLKTKFNLTDVTLSVALGISRATLWKIKKNNRFVSIDIIFRILFLTKHSLNEIFNYYYDSSHEFKGKWPDTYEEFIYEINTNKKFCKMWFNKFYNYKTKTL